MNIARVTNRLVWATILGGMVFAFAPVRAQADVLGEQHTFFVNKSFDKDSRTQIPATLRHASERLYFYTDDRYWNAFSVSQQEGFLQTLRQLGSEFDSRIYPQSVTFWGSDPQPGIDNDTRTTILLQQLLPGNGGYFDSTHMYPLEAGRDSNERDMIMLNLDALNSTLMPVFLGHEFQHLISSYQKDILNSPEEVWLNELRSEYAATLLGQNIPFEFSSLYRRVQSFIKNPSESLVEWANNPSDYGIAAVFGEYLVGRYGPTILSESSKTALSGISSLNDYFARKNISERFSEIFSDWMIASYLNDGSSSRYGYTRSELQNIHVQALNRQTLLLGSETSLVIPIKYWQPTWSDFIVGDASGTAIKLEMIRTASEIPLASVLILYTDGTYDVRRISISQSARTVYFPLEEATGKKIQKIMLAVTYSHDASGFMGNMPAFNFTVKATLIDAATYERAQLAGLASAADESVIPEGALIKHNNAEVEAYVTWGKYKRYLRPEIIALYGHLDPSRTIPVNPDIFNQYAISNYVRAENDKKVYAIWPDGTKHWLNISGEQFTSSGRDWNAIFTINEAELNAYTTGVVITR